MVTMTYVAAVSTYLLAFNTIKSYWAYWNEIKSGIYPNSFANFSKSDTYKNICEWNYRGWVLQLRTWRWNLKTCLLKTMQESQKQECLVKQVAVPRVPHVTISRLFSWWWSSKIRKNICCTTQQILLAFNVWWHKTPGSDLKLVNNVNAITVLSVHLWNQKWIVIFGLWHMDIITGLPTTQGKHKYNHLLGDSYSKRCEAFTLPNQEASEIARVLYKEIITRYGALRTPISDTL